MTDSTVFIAFSYGVKIYKSQDYRKPVLAIILCKTHFRELVIDRFLVIIVLFRLVWGFL